MTACVPETSARSDFELVELSRNGDRTAFGELVSRHYHHCASLAGFILRDRSAACDEVQKASWKAFEHLDQYRGTAEFSTWLLRIVVNECRMVLRVKRRTPFVYLDDSGMERALESPAVAHDPEHELVHREMADVVRREMRYLPPLLRNVIVLRDIEGLQMTEVAARLDVTVAAAKSRLLRARVELRSRVERYFGKTSRHVHRSNVRTLPAKSVRNTSQM
jgi:RNA polymerase sigma-70 factor (ECF subfamily)